MSSPSQDPVLNMQSPQNSLPADVTVTHVQTPSKPSTPLVNVTHENDNAVNIPVEQSSVFDVTQQTLTNSGAEHPLPPSREHPLPPSPRLEAPLTNRSFDPAAMYRAREEISLKNTNVYISGMPLFFTQDDLTTLARPYGHIVESKLLKTVAILGNYTTLSGFVRFYHRHESDAAIQGLNCKEVKAISQVLSDTSESNKPFILSVRYASDAKTREREIHAVEHVLGLNSHAHGHEAHQNSVPIPPLPSGRMPNRPVYNDFRPPLPQSHFHRTSPVGPGGPIESSDPGSPQQGAGGIDRSNKPIPLGAVSIDPLRYSSSGSASGSSAAGPESGAGTTETSIHHSSSSFRSPTNGGMSQSLNRGSGQAYSSAQNYPVYQSGSSLPYSPPLPSSHRSDGYHNHMFYGHPLQHHFIQAGVGHPYIPMGASYFNHAPYATTAQTFAQYIQQQSPGYLPQQTTYGYSYPYPGGTTYETYPSSYFEQTSTPNSPMSATNLRTSPTRSLDSPIPPASSAGYYQEANDVRAVSGMMSQMQINSSTRRSEDGSQPQGNAASEEVPRTLRYSGQRHQNQHK